jgi:hypothetical protein
MNAYEFGLKYFNQKFQPSPNCVVFNDLTKIIDIEETIVGDNFVPASFGYRQVKKKPNQENLYQVIYDNPKRLNGDAVDDYLIPNGYVEIINDNRLEGYPSNYFYTVYKYQGDYYIKTNANQNFDEPSIDLDLIDITIKAPKVATPKFFGSSKVNLREFFNNEKISLVFFFSDDGALLETIYATLKDIPENEIVFFLEKPLLHRALSVTRIKVGNKIGRSSNEVIPYASINHIAKFFEAPFEDENTVKRMFEDVFEERQKEENRSWYHFDIAGFFIEIGADLLQTFIGNPLVGVGEGMLKYMKADPSRWKYYHDDPTKNGANFEPYIPGIKSAVESLGESKEEEIKNRDIGADVSTMKEDIKAAINKIPVESYRKLLHKKLEFIYEISDKLEELYVNIQKIFTWQNGLIYLNALLTGIYNSLIEAIAGILILVGNILSFPAKFVELTGASITDGFKIGVEILENIIEAIISFFSLKNITEFFVGLYRVAKTLALSSTGPAQQISFLSSAAEYIATHVDQIGYAIGYVIGFLVEEVITAIFTGGAKTVATALQMTLDSFKSVLKGVQKVGKYLIEKPIDFIYALSLLYKKIKNLDMKKLMDEFIEWIKKLFKIGKELAIEAFEKFFPNTSKGRKDRRFLKNKGYEPTSFVDNVLTVCPIGR